MRMLALFTQGAENEIAMNRTLSEVGKPTWSLMLAGMCTNTVMAE